MKEIHENLQVKYPWYARWHQNQNHSAAHYVFLLGFLVLATYSVITQTRPPAGSLTASADVVFEDMHFEDRMRGKSGLSGEEAVKALGFDTARVARYYGMSAKELRYEFRTDKSLHINKNAILYYVDEASPGNGLPYDPTPDQIPDALTFQLHSKPNATAKIFLDFDGGIVTGTMWNTNGQITLLPLSTDTDVAFAPNELNIIKTIWRGVAEDYAAFNVDVTTEEPTDGSYDPGHYAWVLITQSSSWYGSAGGVSYLNSFRWGNNTPSFVFSTLQGNNPKNIAEATSHEIGHMLGLRHQATYDGACTKISDYNWGWGSNPGFGPIMGAGYNVGVTTFIDSADFPNWAGALGCNSEQNDIGIITQPSTNTGDLRFTTDEAPASSNLAVNVNRTISNGVATVNHYGIMTQNDTDMYKINTTGGNLNITVSPITPVNLLGNSDFRVRLYDSGMNIVLEVNPNAVAPAVLQATNAAAGQYYLEIAPSGYLTVPTPGSYSSTGSMGQYFITGNFPELATPDGDTIAPTVSMTSPSNNLTVSGPITLVASASDNVGVSKVEFYLGSTLLGTDTSASPDYYISWDTTSVTNGSYSLTAKAYDAAGNSASSSISVTVSNPVDPLPDQTPPTVSITAPANGATLSAISTISASASDNTGVDHVDFYEGSTVIGADAVAPYSYDWDTTTVANGSYIITAKAYDAAGNSASSAASVNVSNSVNPPPDTTPPTVSMTGPVNNATVSSTTTLSASASDNIGVTRVSFYRGTTLIDTDTTASPGYNVLWNTTGVANGGYTLTAKAYDAAGNIATSSGINVIVSNTTTPPPGDTTAPSVTITSPVNGSTVSGSVTVSASATDNVKVTKQELWVDGVLQKTSTKSPISFRWSTRNATAGLHTITAKAYDAAGNVGQTSIIVTK